MEKLPNYVDIHSHPTFKDYDVDREEVLKRLDENNIWTIGVGVDFESSEKEVAFARSRHGYFAAIGLHPHDNTSEIFDEKKYEKLLESGKVVAIGECGLDYFRLTENIEAEKERQRDIFKKQIEFALKNDLPLMLHCRNSYADVLEVLNSYKTNLKLRGNVHFFAGTLDEAKAFWDLGFTTSFTGVITFARNYDEVIKAAPIEMIMSETDAPFVAPAPYRGRRNEPSYVVEVVKKIASIRNEDFEKVRTAMVENAHRVFSLGLK